MNRSAISVTVVVLLGNTPAFATEPTKTECIAANETAQELRRAGRLLEARSRLALCVSASCPGPLREDCQQRLGEVDVAMPSIIFEVRDSAGNDIGAVTVAIDGKVAAEKLDGRPMATDPGEHRFAFSAASGDATEKVFVVREGEKNRRERIVLSTAPVRAQRSETPVVEGSGFAFDRVPTMAYVAAGVGVAGLAIGIGTGIAASSKHDSLEAQGCPANGGTCPATASQSDLDSFHSLKTWSTVGYVIGAAGIVGGVVLWLTSPKASANTATRVWVGPASAGLAGTF